MIHALPTFQSTFPQVVTVAMILVVVPVTTASVERNFCDIKLVNARLRNSWEILVGSSYESEY